MMNITNVVYLAMLVVIHLFDGSIGMEVLANSNEKNDCYAFSRIEYYGDANELLSVNNEYIEAVSAYRELLLNQRAFGNMAGETRDARIYRTMHYNNTSSKFSIIDDHIDEYVPIEVTEPPDMSICTETCAELSANKGNNGYTVQFSHPTYDVPSEWSNEFRMSFFCVCVKMDNAELRNKINRTLSAAQIGWIGENLSHRTSSVGSMVLDSIDIGLQSDRYISIYTRIFLIDHRYWWIHNGVTVDVTIGERVFLDEILDANEECFEYLRSGEALVRCSIAGEYLEITENNRSGIFDYTDESIREMIEECSSEKATDINSLLTDANFYLEKDSLTIAFNQNSMGSEMLYSFDAKALEPYLKVDLW